MPRTKKTDNADVAVSYNELRLQLDDALLKLQDPEIDVDEAVNLYEKALALVAMLERHIEKAENRVTKIQNIKAAL